MLSVTSKTRYGMAIAVELALRYGGAPVQVSEIVARRGVPRSYLVQICNRLAKHGLVRGERGQSGGYTLIRPPDEITVLSLMEALEGPMILSESTDLRSLNEILGGVEADVRGRLAVSLAELAKRQAAVEAVPTYQI